MFLSLLFPLLAIDFRQLGINAIIRSVYMSVFYVCLFVVFVVIIIVVLRNVMLIFCSHCSSVDLFVLAGLICSISKFLF